MKYDTIREATETWVNGFNAIPQGMIKQLMTDHPGDWEEVTIFEDDYEPYDFLPIWGTMWSFESFCDELWLEEELEEDDGIEIMSKLGFRIYYHEEFGYFFGIDAAGLDFYEEYWIPLYKARGLHWHKEEE